MQQELPHLQASQGATEAHKKLKAEKNQLVASDRDRETTFSPSWSLLTMSLKYYTWKLHIALISIKFLNNKNFTHLLKQKILKQSLAFLIFSI